MSSGVVVDDATGRGTPDLRRGHPDFGSTVFQLDRCGERGFASGIWEDHCACIMIRMDADPAIGLPSVRLS